MLNFGVGTATVMVGLFVVGSPFVNEPVGGVGGTTAIYNATPSVPAGLCDSLAGGGVVTRCDPAQLRRAPTPPMPMDPLWLNAVVMGPDPGGKTTKESVDRERGTKPPPSTSPNPNPGQSPGDEERSQKRSENSRLPEDCDAQPGTIKTHCLVYLSLHVRG
jgi:hypothetical protein